MSCRVVNSLRHAICKACQGLRKIFSLAPLPRHWLAGCAKWLRLPLAVHVPITGHRIMLLPWYTQDVPAKTAAHTVPSNAPWYSVGNDLCLQCLCVPWQQHDAFMILDWVFGNVGEHVAF